MKLLLVKTSSLGDVVHALPAVTEAAERIPGLRIDWIVEESFSAIPSLHPSVDRVIPVAVRRWRKHWLGSRREISDALALIRRQSYDAVIDSQGLIKSALIARTAIGTRHGFASDSAREPIAAGFYQYRHHVARDQHAIHRQKALFGAVLGYAPGVTVDYGIRRRVAAPGTAFMLLHGTTWPSKLWPNMLWSQLGEQIVRAGGSLVIPAGNDDELRRATLIGPAQATRILDRQPLASLIEAMTACTGVVSVDTGLGHLAAALGLPTVGIFGATDPKLTGILGSTATTLASTDLPCIPCRKRDCRYQKPTDSSSIYPPCYQQIRPENVWQVLQRLIGSTNTPAG